MSNLLTNWWRGRQFSAALKKGNTYLAQQLLEDTQRTGARLSLLEKIFRDKLQSDQSSAQYKREVVVLREQISQASQTIGKLSIDKQQVEQSLSHVHKQLRHKEQEVISIQQQLEARGQEIQGLRDHLRQKEQEFVSTQQQLEARGRETNSIQQQLEVRGQEIQALHNQLLQATRPLVDNLLLSPHQKFIQAVEDKFRLNKISENLLQCTGIDEGVFHELEENMVKYLRAEFERYMPQESLSQNLKATHYKDIFALKRGQDPQYDSYLSPHVYFMTYFLEGVYSAYLAWFLVYKSGLLRSKVNILDIGAGSGAMIYGLFLLLKSASAFTPLPQSHISYCSLEQQSLLQHHGLEFWKQYIEPHSTTAVNTYCRFHTIDIFTYENNSHEGRELPKNFFDFIVISHCIFANKNQRVKSHKVYQKIFSESLKENGYVLVVVQGRRLFQAFSRNQTENQAQEEILVKNFIEELGLKLEWYKYMTSTGKRISIGGSEFGRFASQNLPTQTYMSPLLRQYLKQKYDSHYTLDDYTILAKKEL
jgi:hypothetical protein